MSKQPEKKYGQKAIEQVAGDIEHLERWPNAEPGPPYTGLRLECPEFTCLCPRSGYPDFATIVIDYVPNEWVVELKALKLYLNGFREVGISHEASTQTIFKTLWQRLDPWYLKVQAHFKVRGNIKTVVTVLDQNPKYFGVLPEYADSERLYRGY